MARSRLAKHPKPALHDEEDAPKDFELSGNPPANDNQPISKSEAVRQAIAAGMDTPDSGTAWIRQTFGLEIQKSHFSAVKAQVKARARKHEPLLPQITGIPQGFGADIKSIRTLIETAGGSEQLKDLAGSIGSLVQKYGANGLSDLIDAFD